jgi:hypothetical protein
VAADSFLRLQISSSKLEAAPLVNIYTKTWAMLEIRCQLIKINPLDLGVPGIYNMRANTTEQSEVELKICSVS